MTRSTVAELLDFWFADSAESPAAARRRHDFWYRANTATDREIRRRFGHLIEAARRGELQHWVSDAEGSLALVIVLDQFTRNVHRSTPLAYYGDALALDVAEHAVATGQLRGLPPTGAVFLLHPYHHSEQLALQDRGLRLLRQQ